MRASTLFNPFRIYELRKRILFTIGIIAAYRIGAAIPTPGVDGRALKAWFEEMQGTIFGFFNLFSGGALENFSVLALGIMPYISASIIMSLLTTTMPALERLQKEGEAGRRKINQYTRYLTLLIAIIHSSGLSIFLQSQYSPRTNLPIVISPGLGFCVMSVLTLTTGAAFVMWLGEQISERGIGNGSSIIIFSNILSGIPQGILATTSALTRGQMNIPQFILLLVILGLIIPGTVMMIQSHRKVPVQYATRVIGRRIYGGQATYIPLQLNMAGVIPLIFAAAALSFVGTFGTAIQRGGGILDYLKVIIDIIPPWIWGVLYYILYIAGIVFFTYFYTAVIFRPDDVADNMRKAGGFIPGIRPGRPTADYLEKILKRITFVGAVFLVVIALVPMFLMKFLKVPFPFGATALLIVVGVALDTVRQIESHMITSHYEGFIKKAKIRGRF
jgi:preprotein translocase subunit SecY